MSHLRITQEELSDMDMNELIDNVGSLHGHVQSEGRAGVVSLCALARNLGYRDQQNFGQLDRHAAIGDLIQFLEDNSGAIEAVYAWIAKVGNRNDEWKQRLGTVLVEAGAVEGGA